MFIPQVSSHASRVDELLPAELAVDGFVEMIAEGFLAQLLVAHPADEIVLVAVEVLADVLRFLFLGWENRFAILAGILADQASRFVLPSGL